MGEEEEEKEQRIKGNETKLAHPTFFTLKPPPPSLLFSLYSSLGQRSSFITFNNES